MNKIVKLLCFSSVVGLLITGSQYTDVAFAKVDPKLEEKKKKLKKVEEREQLEKKAPVGDFPLTLRIGKKVVTLNEDEKYMVIYKCNGGECRSGVLGARKAKDLIKQKGMKNIINVQ